MWLVAFIFFFAALLGFLVGGLRGAPWVPARKADLERIIDDAGLKKGQLFIELGCGDGRLLSAASKRGVRAIGYEINPIMWLIAATRNLANKSVSVRLANFWEKDLSEADAVMTFLMPRFMSKLERKLAKELKPNTVFISYVFSLPNKKPSKKRRNWLVYKY